ncbi:MAG: hypothetical protein KBD78_00185 [Oligoflexales bacterium]|nr:hypothetical protein [Oligoflexales bacterium]
MTCVRKCPHYIRHGYLAQDGKTIQFKDMCGLSMRKTEIPRPKVAEQECSHHPFVKGFEYSSCATYLAVFKTGDQRNNASPTSDFQFSDALAGGSLADMELF